MTTPESAPLSARSTSRSGWGDFDEEVVIYKHVGRTTIEQWTSVQRVGFGEPHRAKATTYVTRDPHGRIISRAVHYGPELWQRDSTVYTYFADRIESSEECGELDSLCWLDRVFDLDGNELSRTAWLESVPESTSAYDFDTTGNWTKRRELSRGPYEERSERVETRVITYK